jgi:hypothetical protein
MTEDAGRRVGAGVDFLQVRAADAAGMDAKEDFARTDLGHGNGFEANVIFAPVNDGAHVSRQGDGGDWLRSQS